VALVALLAFATAGCANTETDFYPQDSQFADAGCRAVANDRAIDAAMIVADADVQQQVFRRSYANCIDWRRTH